MSLSDKFFCLLTGHHPYTIDGIYEDWNIMPDRTPLQNQHFTIIKYDPPKMIESPETYCLACGKKLR